MFPPEQPHPGSSDVPDDNPLLELTHFGELLQPGGLEDELEFVLVPGLDPTGPLVLPLDPGQPEAGPHRAALGGCDHDWAIVGYLVLGGTNHTELMCSRCRISDFVPDSPRYQPQRRPRRRPGGPAAQPALRSPLAVR